MSWIDDAFPNPDEVDFFEPIVYHRWIDADGVEHIVTNINNTTPENPTEPS